MSGYITPPGDNSPSAIAEDAFAYLESAIPGWQAAPGNLDTLIIEAFAQHASEVADVASAALTSVFRRFGTLVGVPAIDAIPAEGEATFGVTVSVADQTIEAGSTIGVYDAQNDLQGFTLIDDLVIAAGGSTGSATVQAEEPGVAANNLSGVAELVDVPAFVTAASLGVTAQGVDAESDEVYLDRLTETLTLLSPRPILPGDFAILARGVAGVYRVAAVDGLKPSSTSGAVDKDGNAPTGAEATGQTRVVSVSPVADDGTDVSLTTLKAVAAKLGAEREQTFNVYAVPPQRAAIDVTATVKAWTEDTDLVDLAARAEAQIRSFLDPTRYAPGPSANPRTWENDPVLRASQFYRLLEDVTDVRYVVSLSFGLHGGSMGTVDVTMGAGSAVPVLPVATTISVTAVA